MMAQHSGKTLSQATFGQKRKDFLNFAIETHARQKLGRILNKH
jgi:hypothetical protein